MNERSDCSEFKPEDPRLIDRLVDGELDEDGRRQVLLSLDYAPDGWRRLALSFVEAQAWREELGEFVGPTADATAAAAVPTQKSPSRLTFLLAVAASFSFAFLLAWMLRNANSTRTGEQQMVNVVQQTSIAEDEDAHIEKLVQPESSVLRIEDPVTFEQLADDAEPAIDLPLIAVGAEGDPWQRVERPALPDNIKRLLERIGHRVRSRRHLIPIDLGDGQRVVVPVEQVEVEFQGTGEYQ